MKKLFVLCLTAALLFAAGCTPNASGGEQDEWGITLGAEDVTSTGMTLVCTQSGGTPTGELLTGARYTLQQADDGVWHPVQPLLGDENEIVWTMEGWMILPNQTTKWDVNWEFLYGELGPGIYRIQKEIMDFRGPGDFTQRPYYAEFAIVD